MKSFQLKSLWPSLTYFPYQVEGIKWMIEKELTGTLVYNEDQTQEYVIYGGIQCDDMGLGKTVQTVATMVNNCKRDTLLIAPLAVVDAWVQVCTRAGFCVYELINGEWICSNANDPFPNHFRKLRPNVFITNYEKVLHAPDLFEQRWDRIVLDEAHKIRNGNGRLAQCIFNLVAPIRWAITGTPLVNSHKDIVSLLSFIGVPVSSNFSWNDMYLVILPHLLLHRSLDSLRKVIKNAPPIPEIYDEVLPFITDTEQEFYKGIQCTDGALQYAQDVMSSVQSFQLLLRLRQLSVHPQIYIDAKRREDSTYDRPDWTVPSTKFERIKDIILEDTETRVHKYIIFCQFIDEMNLLREELSYLVPEILMYHGGLSQKERTEVLEYSKNTTRTTVMLLQLQAGGVGLNLQEYDRIIFVSPWWTSALMNQAVARAVRMGQTKVVKVYHLRLEEESDEAIINIDSTMRQKADEKQEMLLKIFKYCAEEQERRLINLSILDNETM
jgi:SNF2 family DNA or RNA helicase